MEEIDYGSWQPSRGAPSTLGEVYDSSLDAQRKFQNVNAYTRNLMDAYDRVNDEVKKSLGTELINPFNRYRAQPGDAMGAPGGSVYDPEASAPDPVKQWEADLDDLAGKHPTALDWAALKSRPLSEVAKLMKASEDKQSDVSQRRGFIDPKDIPGIGRVPLVRDVVGGAANIVKDPAGMAASFAGSLRGSLESPVDTLANVVGGVAGSASKSLVKNAIRNGLANAGVQSVLEPVVQANRAAGGLEYGWDKAFEDIAGAFGTGAALDLAVRPAGRAAIKRFGSDTPDGTFSRNVERGGLIFDAPEQLPLPPVRARTPDLSPELIERARNDDVAALREIAEKTGIIDQPAVKGALDYAELGGKVDEAAIARFKEMGVDTGEGMRTLAAVMKDPDRFTRMPEPIRQAAAPLMRDEAQALIAERGEQVTAMLAQMPATVARVVAHALEAGLPQVVPLVREALASMERNPTAALTDFTAKIEAMDGLADVAIVHGSNNLVEVADALRRSPQAMDSNVPVSTDFMRTARDLAALEPDAYDLVRSGEVAPAVGAEVANRVMPGHQARVLADLRKAGVQTAAQARQMISDILPNARAADEMPLSGGSRIDDPAGPEAKAQTDRLREEHSEALKEAKAPIKERDKVEAEVETIRGEIAKLEEKAAIGAKPEAAKKPEGFDPFESLQERTKQAAETTDVNVFADLAAKRDELRAAETRLAELNNDLIPGDYSPMFAFIAERVEMQRAMDVRTAVNDALRLADTILPENARVTVTADRLDVDGVALDAMERAGDITLALHALDPAARLGHEGVHALVSRGHLSPQEVDLLAQAGRATKAFSPEIEARYREAYADRPNLERQIAEEAAAHFVEAKIKSPAPEVQTIADRVRALIQRVKNALDGYGFKTADDVRAAILRGDVAKRQAQQQWMRSNDVTALASDGQTMAAFAGERAKTADPVKLGRAKTMDAAGLTREAIWTETGWFKGVDGKWRFEIDDSKSYLDLNAARADGMQPDQKWPLDHVLGHKELFAAYPDMEKTGIRYRAFPDGYDDAAASYVGRTDDIVLNSRYRDFANDAAMQSFVLHEGQHRIQATEGFPRGGSARMFIDAEIAAERKRILSINDDGGWTSVGTASGDMPDRDVGRSLYRRLAGETEARTVQKRMDLTPDQRAARPPWLDYDVPEDQQIVRYADGVPMSAKDKNDVMFALRSSGLDPSPEARKARAEEMGFDTSKVWYHGTGGELRGGEFDPNMGGDLNPNPLSKEGHFLSAHPDVAGTYAEGAEMFRNNGGANIIPAYIKTGRQKVIDFNGYDNAVHTMWESVKPAKDAGYDSVILRNQWNGNGIGVRGASTDPKGIDHLTVFHSDERGKPTKIGLYRDVKDQIATRPMEDFFVAPDEIVVFDPKNIRSVNAMFDPDKAGSANLMFALSGVRAGAETIDPSRVELRKKSLKWEAAKIRAKSFAADFKEYGLEDARALKIQRDALDGAPNGEAIAIYDIMVDGKKFGDVALEINGPTANVVWIGNSETDGIGGFSASATLGVPALKKMRDQLRQDYPDVRRFTGQRISGSRALADDKSQSVMFALADPEPPKPPLHSEVAMLDRLSKLKDLAAHCKG